MVLALAPLQPVRRKCLDWLTLTEEAAVEQGSLVMSLVSDDLLRIVALRKQHEHKRELLSLPLSLSLLGSCLPTPPKKS